MRILEHPLAEILPTTSNPFQTHTSLLPLTSRTWSWIQITTPLASAPTSASLPSAASTPGLSHQRRTPTPPLSNIFTPFPPRLMSADLAYLQLRDALTLPPEELQVELLKAYVEFVNRSMPLLDLEEFLSIVKYGYNNPDTWQPGIGMLRPNGYKGKQISLLLFQSVMFAAVEFVDLKFLRDAGYGTRESAQRAFFSRARVSLGHLCPSFGGLVKIANSLFLFIASLRF